MLDSLRHRYKCRTIEKNLDYLVQFAFFRINNKEDAEDIVYESITRSLEIDDPSLKISSMRAYLFRIVYNRCMDYDRHPKSNSLRLSEVEIEIPDETNMEYVESVRINDILKSLPSKFAEIIEMKLVDNISFVDISKILDIPNSTVKSRFKAGIELLRKSKSLIHPQS